MIPEHAPSTPDTPANPRLDPAAMSIDDAAKVLSRIGGTPVTEAMLAVDIEAGELINPIYGCEKNESS